MPKIREVLLDDVCSDGNCHKAEEPIDLRAKEERAHAGSGGSRWIEAFCPQQACEITSPIELP